MCVVSVIVVASWSTCLLCVSVVGGTGDAYEVALLNGCDMQDASQFVSQQQPQQLTVLYNNNVLPIS